MMFLKYINNFGLDQFVLVSTKIAAHSNSTGTILDLVFTNMYHQISDLQVLCPFSTSDHNMLKLSMNLPYACNMDATVDEFYYDYKNADYSLLNIYMLSNNWLHEFSFVFGTENCWNVFLSHVSHAVQLCVPVKKRP
jgi:hypothetical protein